MVVAVFGVAFYKSSEEILDTEYIQAQKANINELQNFEKLLKNNECYTIDVQSRAYQEALAGRGGGTRTKFEQSMFLNGNQYPLITKASNTGYPVEYFKYPIKYYCAKGEVNYSTNLYFLDLDLYSPVVSKYRPSAEEVLKTKDKKFVYQPIFDACYKGTSLIFEKPCN